MKNAAYALGLLFLIGCTATQDLGRGADDAGTTDTEAMVQAQDSASDGNSSTDASLADSNATDGPSPSCCVGRVCGAAPACAISCGSCSDGLTCTDQGLCEANSNNGPRFIDPPTIDEPEPVAAGTTIIVSATVTDPQGVNTIAAGEVRNPNGPAGVQGRYAAFIAPAGGAGQYTATIPWSAFSANNGGVPEDVSGTTTRVLRIRFVDQDGNELVRDLVVRLGGCREALCGGRCADCPANATARMCNGTMCQVCAGATQPTDAGADGGASCSSPWRQTSSIENVLGMEVVVYDQRNRNFVMLDWNQTWLFDGSAWRQLPTSRTPPGRWGHELVYDSQRQRVFVHGGEGDNNTRLTDTWSFDGTDWTQIQTTQSPPPRANFSMVHDGNSGNVLLIGGRQGTDLLDDTWAFDGADWRQLQPTNRPPAGEGFVTLFDETLQRVMLIGNGSNGATQVWLFDGDWRRASPLGAPGTADFRWVSGPAAAYDAASGRVVLFGARSRDLTQTTVNHTWSLRENRWSQLNTATSPPEGFWRRFVYDRTRQRMVLFFGNQTRVDTWELAF